MRLQEKWDARLLIHENPQFHELTHLDAFFDEQVLVLESSYDSIRNTESKKYQRARMRDVLFALWFFFVISLAWEIPAGASAPTFTALDEISQSSQLSVTNTSDNVELPSELFIASATLSTIRPGENAIQAPRGKIFLSLQMSSGPVQRQYGQAQWGSFFSTMTALPGAALRYVTASGRSYIAMRVDSISQANNPNAATDDGLVDATYFFMVPITNRRGTVVISSSRTTGVEYKNFVGGALVPLTIGGPTKIVLSFPKNLTVAAKIPKRVAAAPYTTFASGMNLLATLIAASLVGFVLWRRGRKGSRRQPTPVFVTGNAPPPRPSAPSVVTFEQVPVPVRRPDVSAETSNAEGETTLRVDVLGPLRISPVNAPASDPVRAIVAFLAMNNERMLSLEEIQNAIWPLTDTGTDIKKPAMRNYMVDARKTVGERHLPTASGRPGYQLQHFDTDWTGFQGLLAQATGSSKNESLALRRQALDLVKGLPFSADTTRYFTWTFTSSVVYKIVETVTKLAHGLGTELVLSGDLANAQVVLRQGLLTDPASLTLWEDLTDVLLESTDQSLLDLHWKSAGLVLRSEDVIALRSRANG